MAPFARTLGSGLGGHGGRITRGQRELMPQASAHLRSVGELITAVDADPEFLREWIGDTPDGHLLCEKICDMLTKVKAIAEGEIRLLKSDRRAAATAEAP